MFARSFLWKFLCKRTLFDETNFSGESVLSEVLSALIRSLFEEELLQRETVSNTPAKSKENWAELPGPHARKSHSWNSDSSRKQLVYWAKNQIHTFCCVWSVTAFFPECEMVCIIHSRQEFQELSESSSAIIIALRERLKIGQSDAREPSLWVRTY